MNMQMQAEDVNNGYKPFKRGIDFLGAGTLAVASLPVIGITALLVKATSPGPIFIRQERLTEGGRVFTMYKFRTMRADAEGKSGAVWASKNDKRVTPLGRLLRSTRLDELPQLWNVLRGDMSLIGPRPERPEFAEMLTRELPGFEKRLRVRGGITGLAQVRAGYSDSVESYRKKLALDILYVQKQSLLLDLQITLRTLAVVVSGHGAQ